MDYLEQRSAENLVWFYQEELIKIDSGEKASSLLPTAVRRRLISLGILRLGVGLPCSFVLTSKGRKILADVTKDRIPGCPGGHSRTNPRVRRE